MKWYKANSPKEGKEKEKKKCRQMDYQQQQKNNKIVHLNPNS